MKEYLYKPKKLEALSFEIKYKLEKKKNISFFQKLKKIFSKK
jgi:hypothetical protein